MYGYFVFICFSLFDFYFLKRIIKTRYDHKKSTMLFVLFLIVCLMFFLLLDERYDSALIHILMLVMLAWIQFLFLGNFIKKAALHISLILFQELLFFVFFLGCDLVNPAISGTAKFWIAILIYLIAATFCIIHTHRRSTQDFRLMLNRLPANILILYTFFPLSSYFLLFYVSCVNIEFFAHPGYWYLMIMIMVILSVNYLAFSLTLVLNDQKQQSENSIREIKMINESRKNYYQMLDHKVNEVLIYKHDMKHQFAVLDTLASEGNLEGIKDFLKLKHNDMLHPSVKRYSTNNTLNAIITHYQNRAELAQIESDIMIAWDEEVCIDIYDLCIIIGNAFENAIEACERMKEGKRYIRIRSDIINQSLVLNITNSYQGTIQIQNNHFITSKEEGGIGIESMKQVIAKYDGFYTIDYDEQEFRLHITLQHALLNEAMSI